MSTNGTQKIPVIGVPLEPQKKGKAPKAPRIPKQKAQKVVPKPAPKPKAKPKRVRPQAIKDGFVELRLGSESEICAYRLFMQTNLSSPEFLALSSTEKKERRASARLEFLQKKEELTKQWDMFTVKPVLESRKKRKQKTNDPTPLMEKIIEKPIFENPKPEPSEQRNNSAMSSEKRGYQYLEEDWLKTTWKSSPPTNSEYEAFEAAARYPPINSYQPSTSQYNPKPVETNYSTFLSQISPYQQSQEPSAYHKMFHSSVSMVPQPSQLPADMEAAVAMQQRLLEIDKELEEIERQKVEMAMADELRRREAELKEKEKWLERKEREFKRREEEMRRRRRSRSPRSSSRERNYRREERREDRREDRRSTHQDHHHRHDTRPSSSSRVSAFQPSLVSSFSSSSAYRAEIRIEMRDRLREERDADAARRHGQTRRRLPSGQDAQRRGSSGHSADYYGRLEIDDISDDDNW